MSESRDSCIQPGGAPAVSNQEAQKRADCCDTPFRGGPPALLSSLQHEVPQHLRVKRGRIFSDILQQITKITAVVIQGGIARSALLSHPATERDQQGRFRDGFLIDRSRQYARKPEVPNKQANPVLQLQPMSAAEPCASASIQVVGKLPDESFLQARNWYASSANPMNEMLGRAQMPASSKLCIAHLVQRLGKSFKQVARGVVADFLHT
jgi:hypothetical protein